MCSLDHPGRSKRVRARRGSSSPPSGAAFTPAGSRELRRCVPSPPSNLLGPDRPPPCQWPLGAYESRLRRSSLEWETPGGGFSFMCGIGAKTLVPYASVSHLLYGALWRALKKKGLELNKGQARGELLTNWRVTYSPIGESLPVSSPTLTGGTTAYSVSGGI